MHLDTLWDRSLLAKVPGRGGSRRPAPRLAEEALPVHRDRRLHPDPGPTSRSSVWGVASRATSTTLSRPSSPRPRPGLGGASPPGRGPPASTGWPSTPRSRSASRSRWAKSRAPESRQTSARSACTMRRRSWRWARPGRAPRPCPAPGPRTPDPPGRAYRTCVRKVCDHAHTVWNRCTMPGRRSHSEEPTLVRVNLPAIDPMHIPWKPGLGRPSRPARDGGAPAPSWPGLFAC